MSRNSCITTCVVLVTLLCLSGGLSAQGPSLKRSQRPVTSPYLNLLNRGNNNFFSDPGLNYYRNVRPEQEWRQGLQNQDKELQSLAQEFNKARSAASDAAASKSIRSTLNTTGHSTSFQNSGGYFRRR